MKILLNTTSPYVRLARIALSEKGLDGIETRIVNPWADDPALLDVNPAGRVPAVVTDRGHALSESLLIVLWLERTHPAPSLLDGDTELILAQSGVAYGVIEAAVHTLVGRVITDAGFDEAPVGLRRRRTMLAGFEKLERDPPSYTGGVPSLAVITAVVALDYVRFRFGQAAWFTPRDRLDALRARVAERSSFASTEPYQ